MLAAQPVIPPTLGHSIPADTPHVSLGPVSQSHYTDSPQAVSVSLPTWKSNVGYEEGDDWVISRMTTGYPRYVLPACWRIGTRQGNLALLTDVKVLHTQNHTGSGLVHSPKVRYSR